MYRNDTCKLQDSFTLGKGGYGVGESTEALVIFLE